MLAVETRAGKRKRQQQEEGDEAASKTSGAEITAWDELPADGRIAELDDPEIAAWETLEEDMEAQLDLPGAAHDLADSAKEFQQAQREDTMVSQLWERAKMGEDSSLQIVRGTFCKTVLDDFGQIVDLPVVPQPLRRKAFQEAHAGPASGHFSYRKTKDRLCRLFYWPQMAKDIRLWTRCCLTCQRGNIRKTHKEALHPLPVIAKPWSRVAIDIVGPLSRTKRGHRYILTILDHGSRYPKAIPLKKHDAETVAKELLTVFARFGILEELLSDNGPEFVGAVVKHLLRSLDIKHLRTTEYRPQTNGAIERWYGVLKSIIRKAKLPEENWDDLLPYSLLACRSCVHKATGFTPFQLLFGRDMRCPTSILKEAWILPEKIPVWAKEFLEMTSKNFKAAYERVELNGREAKKLDKKFYDRGASEDQLREGDYVLVLQPRAKTGLSASWEGPYQILRKSSPVKGINCGIPAWSSCDPVSFQGPHLSLLWQKRPHSQSLQKQAD